MTNLDCSSVAEAIDNETKDIISAQCLQPRLLIVREGDDAGDAAYINAIKRKAEKLGITVNVCGLMDYEEEVCFSDGVICMSCHSYMEPLQDVDGLNLDSCFNPCTAEAIIRILEHHGVEMSGTNATVVGRSKRVGLPAARMLINKDATVRVCHSKTHPKTLDVSAYMADILVSAVGKPNLFDGNYFLTGTVIVDVGMGVDEDGKLAGDVSDDRNDDVTYIGPREVGKVTTSVLLNHVARAAM